MHVLFKVDGRPLHVRALGAGARALANMMGENEPTNVTRKPIFDKTLHRYCSFAAGRQGVGARSARAPASIMALHALRVQVSVQCGPQCGAPHGRVGRAVRRPRLG